MTLDVYQAEGARPNDADGQHDALIRAALIIGVSASRAAGRLPNSDQRIERFCSFRELTKVSQP
jgi:hypothetical protein